MVLSFNYMSLRIFRIQIVHVTRLPGLTAYAAAMKRFHLPQDHTHVPMTSRPSCTPAPPILSVNAYDL